jgi:hypothetical protein
MKDKVIVFLQNELNWRSFMLSNPIDEDTEIILKAEIKYLTELIESVKKAKFDFPSQEEIEKTADAYIVGFGNIAAKCFEKGCNFILNYETMQE